MRLAASDTPAPALKEIFNAARFHHIGTETAAVYPAFDRAAFLATALPGLKALSPLQRLRRMTESLHHTLPADYATALHILRKLAPRINSSFVTLVLPDYAGCMAGMTLTPRSMR